MAIRPIDLQVMIPQTAEAGKIMNHDQPNHRPEVAQQQFAEKLQKEVEHEEQRVQKSEKGEQGKVDRDGHKRGGQDAKKKQDKDKQQAEEGGAPRGMFDVTI